MRFAELDAWALQDSVLHRRDARAKIVAFLFLLAAISRGHLLLGAAVAGLALVTARLPILPVLLRACVVLPFSLSFALVSILGGRADVAAYALARSYISAVAAVVLIGCTPLPSFLAGLRRLGAPAFLLEVAQFIYRYLTLIGEQSRRMSLAATARGARRSFGAVVGSVGVLFARSYDRAEAVHRAMLARGYTGSFVPHTAARFTSADFALIFASAGVLAASLVSAR